MLLQESGSCALSGAVSLCNPFNLVVADEDLRKGFNLVYTKTLANGLSKIFKKYYLEIILIFINTFALLWLPG